MKKLVMTLFSISALSLVALLSSVAQAELENPGARAVLSPFVATHL